MRANTANPQRRGQRRFVSKILKTIRDFLKRKRYEPARHYMRGPGPASLQRAKRPRDDT
jgi:hypothetical protein